MCTHVGQGTRGGLQQCTCSAETAATPCGVRAPAKPGAAGLKSGLIGSHLPSMLTHLQVFPHVALACGAAAEPAPTDVGSLQPASQGRPQITPCAHSIARRSQPARSRTAAAHSCPRALRTQPQRHSWAAPVDPKVSMAKNSPSSILVASPPCSSGAAAGQGGNAWGRQPAMIHSAGVMAEECTGKLWNQPAIRKALQQTEHFDTPATPQLLQTLCPLLRDSP